MPSGMLKINKRFVNVLNKYSNLNKIQNLLLLVLVFNVITFSNSYAQTSENGENISPQAITERIPDKLVVLWTSDDPMVAERIALMYTHAAKTAAGSEEVAHQIELNDTIAIAIAVRADVSWEGGAELLMKSMAQELDPKGIRINSVAPGTIQTPINRDAWVYNIRGWRNDSLSRFYY